MAVSGRSRPSACPRMGLLAPAATSDPLPPFGMTTASDRSGPIRDLGFPEFCEEPFLANLRVKRSNRGWRMARVYLLRRLGGAAKHCATRGIAVANAEIRLVTSWSPFCLAKNSVLEAGQQVRSGAPDQVSLLASCLEQALGRPDRCRNRSSKLPGSRAGISVPALPPARYMRQRRM